MKDNGRQVAGGSFGFLVLGVDPSLPVCVDLFVGLIHADPTPSKCSNGTLLYVSPPLSDPLIENVFHMYLVTLLGSDYHGV